MDLKDYLAANSDETMTAFAERVDTTVATVSRIVAGSLRPSLDLAFRIERATNGKVPMRQWARQAETKAVA